MGDSCQGWAGSLRRHLRSPLQDQSQSPLWGSSPVNWDADLDLAFKALEGFSVGTDSSLLPHHLLIPHLRAYAHLCSLPKALFLASHLGASVGHLGLATPPPPGSIP